MYVDKALKKKECVCSMDPQSERCLPGASDSSRVWKGSGTTNSEAPESTSRMADALSTRKQKQCFTAKIYNPF